MERIGLKVSYNCVHVLSQMHVHLLTQNEYAKAKRFIYRVFINKPSKKFQYY